MSKTHNPQRVDWKRQAAWHEAEGSRTLYRKKGKKAVLVADVLVVSQHMNRREIPETLCRELQNAGFKSAKLREMKKKNALRCEIDRVLEQECYLTRIKPYIISQKIRKEIDAVLTHLKRTKHLGLIPEPFTCPE